MTEKEKLKKLIDDSKQSNLLEWVYEVEDFLESIEESTQESKELIQHIKIQRNTFGRCENLVALLRQLYKRKYDKVELPPITKRNQIFVAMMFSADMTSIYENGYKPVIQSLNYAAMRIDEKDYTGSIIDEIKSEITDSVALIADLTGNRGGVYYEAGIAKGLQLCNHPIKLVLACKQDYFDKEKVHFDVSGDKILLYNNESDLKTKLTKLLQSILG